MSPLYLILSSLVEGLTEFLPVSSTGHLIILNHFFKQSGDLISSYNIFIQLGAILAVVSLYTKEILDSPKQIKNILISFTPTAIVGFTLYPIIKSYLLDNIFITTLALFLGGVLIFFLNQKKSSSKELSNLDYSKIGIFQSLSIVPGTSRALMTIIGGLNAGLNITDSIRYSFLLAIPTILSATALDFLENKDLIFQNPLNIQYFLMGFVLSFITARITLNKFQEFSRNKGLISFGYYRIALSIILFILFILPK